MVYDINKSSTKNLKKLVFDAVKHASDEIHSIPLPDSVTEAMHALSKTDELSAIVGNVEDAFQVPSCGALYVVYSIEDKFASSIDFLILVNKPTDP